MNILYLTAGNTQPDTYTPANKFSIGFPITVHAHGEGYQGTFGVGGIMQLRGMGAPDMVYLESHLSEEDEQAVIEWIAGQYPDAGIILVCEEEDEEDTEAYIGDISCPVL